MTLILANGPATREEIAAVAIPETTETFNPMSHIAFLSMIDETIERKFGHGNFEKTETVGLTNEGDRMFGTISLKLDSEEYGISWAFRNAIDKSISAAIAAGTEHFVCSNLCFSTDGIVYARKHTPNVVIDMADKIREAVDFGPDFHDALVGRWDTMKTIPLDLNRGFEHLGRARGNKILSPTQHSIALAEWEAPRHREFEERNLFSLYQSCTEAAKKGAPELIMDRYPKIDRFFEEAILVRPQSPPRRAA